MNTGILIVTFREALEAAMVIAIIFTILNEQKERRGIKFVISGIFAGILGSIAFAQMGDFIYDLFDGTGQEIFNAIILITAALLITTFIFWVNGKGGELQKEIKSKVTNSLSKGQLIGIFFLVFFSVLREGVELVFFLGGIFIQSKGAYSLVTALLSGFAGIVAAILLVYLLFSKIANVNIKFFFQGTTIMLVFVSAGMLASAGGVLISIDILPAIANQAWNSAWILDETSAIGSVFSIFFGYNSNPTVMEVMIYFFYLAAIAILLLFFKTQKNTALSKKAM